MATKANKKAVLSQLIALSETLKYSADVLDIAANESHLEEVSVRSP